MDTANRSDEQIVEHALAGDREAFGELVQRWERRIFALAYGILSREEDARDATQETFIAAFRHLGGFRGEAKVSSWLHRIAVNQCISRQRRASVRPETSLEFVQQEMGAQFAAPPGASPLRQTERQERSEAVGKAVGALPLELREVIVLKEFEELTFQEIADTLQIPLSTVKSRFYTALKQLRLKLEKYGVEAAHA